jgi:hypothetical protein
LILAAPPLEAGFKIPVGEALKVALSPRIGHHSMYDLIDEWPKAFKESEEYLISGDEFCTKKFGLGFLFNVQTKLANKIMQNASKIELPVFLIHGDADIIALPNSSKRILEKLAVKDKTLQMFIGADHWFYQGIIPQMSSRYSLEQKKQVFGVVKNWLEKQSENKSKPCREDAAATEFCKSTFASFKDEPKWDNLPFPETQRIPLIRGISTIFFLSVIVGQFELTLNDQVSF